MGFIERAGVQPEPNSRGTAINVLLTARRATLEATALAAIQLPHFLVVTDQPTRFGGLQQGEASLPAGNFCTNDRRRERSPVACQSSIEHA